MDGWYVGVNGQQRGPLSFDDALAAARSAGAAQTYVWREGFGEWKIAADVPEFADALRSAAPTRPLPPRMGAGHASSDTQFSGEYAGTGGRGVSFVEAIKLGFAKYATFSGRAPRSEYWYWVLFNVLVSIVASMFDVMLVTTSGFGFLGMIVWLALLIPGVAVMVRRLHDIDRTGWWALFGLIAPIFAMTSFFAFPSTVYAVAGIALFALGIMFLVWLCTRGTSGPNRFGEDPLA